VHLKSIFKDKQKQYLKDRLKYLYQNILNLNIEFINFEQRPKTYNLFDGFLDITNTGSTRMNDILKDFSNVLKSASINYNPSLTSGLETSGLAGTIRLVVNKQLYNLPFGYVDYGEIKGLTGLDNISEEVAVFTLTQIVAHEYRHQIWGNDSSYLAFIGGSQTNKDKKVWTQFAKALNYDNHVDGVAGLSLADSDEQIRDHGMFDFQEEYRLRKQLVWLYEQFGSMQHMPTS
jgi:hypothetical protein